VFCPHHGLFTVTFRTTTPSHLVGASVHPGAFVNVGPSNKTRLQSSNATITGEGIPLRRRIAQGGFLLFFSDPSESPLRSSPLWKATTFSRRTLRHPRFQKFFPLPICHFLFLNGAPVLPIAIDQSLSSNSDILKIAAINHRNTFHRALGAFEHRIVFEPFAEQNHRATVEMKFDVALHFDRACEPHSRRDRTRLRHPSPYSVESQPRRLRYSWCCRRQQPQSL